MNRIIAAIIPLILIPLFACSSKRTPINDEVTVSIPAGSFKMGCNLQVETLCANNEQPFHEESVAAFEMDQYEVTVRRYRQCVHAGACPDPTKNIASTGDCNFIEQGRNDYPMNCVTRDEAAAFCARDGKRLPTEIEWEYAARGATSRVYPWGDVMTPCYSLPFADSARDRWCETAQPRPVGDWPRDVSPFGAVDIAGGVREWTASPYRPNLAMRTDDAPLNLVVVRGGSFGAANKDFRTSLRAFGRTDFGNPYTGFRCVRDRAENKP